MFSSVPNLPLEFVKENCVEDGRKHPKIDTFHLYLEKTLEVRILSYLFLLSLLRHLSQKNGPCQQTPTSPLPE